MLSHTHISHAHTKTQKSPLNLLQNLFTLKTKINIYDRGSVTTSYHMNPKPSLLCGYMYMYANQDSSFNYRQFVRTSIFCSFFPRKKGLFATF